MLSVPCDCRAYGTREILVQVFAQAPAGKKTVIEVPFEFIHQSIVVQATVNGHGPFWMLLDTGADPSIVELATNKPTLTCLWHSLTCPAKSGSNGWSSTETDHIHRKANADAQRRLTNNTL